MSIDIKDGLPKGPDGEPLKVFGEMPVDEYKKALEGRYKRVEVLQVSPETIVALGAMPNGRLELHPRITAGIVDLVPTAYDPGLRAPVFVRQDQQRNKGV